MSPHSPDINDVLAYEIKKEIADRYFGFRKLIEEDKLDFVEKTRQYSFILEKRISFDLIRTYILLSTDELIHAFLDLTGLPEDLFYDPYLTQSANIRQRVFEGVHIHGLTLAGRFKNLAFDCYDRLEIHVGQYREKFAELVRYREEINEEIDVFYRNNDLGSIIGFLRTMGNHGKSGGMEGGMEVGMAQNLERSMRIDPQLPVENFLPLLPPLPPLDTIKADFKRLLDDAFRLHGKTLLGLLTHHPAARRDR
ncbi:MAG: hypothetical protein ACOY3Z_12715 [Thermodesulfobacteriota bacterium]